MLGGRPFYFWHPERWRGRYRASLKFHKDDHFGMKFAFNELSTLLDLRYTER